MKANQIVPRLGSAPGSVPNSLIDAELLLLRVNRDRQLAEVELRDSLSKMETDFDGDELRWSQWVEGLKHRVKDCITYEAWLNGWVLMQKNTQEQSAPPLPVPPAVPPAELQPLQDRVTSLYQRVDELEQKLVEARKYSDLISGYLETTLRQFIDYLYRGPARGSGWWLSGGFNAAIRLRQERGKRPDQGLEQDRFIYKTLMETGIKPPFTAEQIKVAIEAYNRKGSQSSKHRKAG